MNAAVMADSGTVVAGVDPAVREDLVTRMRGEIVAGSCATWSKYKTATDRLMNDASGVSDPVSELVPRSGLQVPTCVGCNTPKTLSGGHYRCMNKGCVINIHHGSCSSGD